MNFQKLWLPLFLLALLLIPGCGDMPEAEAPAAPMAESAAPVPAQEGSMTAAQTKSQSRALTEEEILTAYERAVTAYEWFDLATLPCQGEALNVDGQLYYPVSASGMGTLEDLRIYLRSLFSQEVTDRLLASGSGAPLYMEAEGRLYVLPAGRDRASGKGDIRVQVEQASETAYFVNVAVDLLDEDPETVVGVECYAFPYELVDGRWVFTDFRLVY